MLCFLLCFLNETTSLNVLISELCRGCWEKHSVVTCSSHHTQVRLDSCTNRLSMGVWHGQSSEAESCTSKFWSGEAVIFESEFIKHHLSSRLQMDSGSHTWLQSLDNSHCISGVWVQAHLEYKFRMKEIHANTRHIIRHCQLFSSTYKTVSEKAMFFLSIWWNMGVMTRRYPWVQCEPDLILKFMMSLVPDTCLPRPFRLHSLLSLLRNGTVCSQPFFGSLLEKYLCSICA